MRTIAGPSLTVGGGRLVGAAEEQSCSEECEHDDVGWVTVGNNDGRWGHMVGEHLGVSAGATLAAPGGRRSGLTGLVVGYGQLSVQNEVASVALGAELGLNVASPVVGLDLQPWGTGVWSPNLSLYARRSWVFSGDDSMDIEVGAIGVAAISVAGSSWDAGSALRLGPLLLQYALFLRDSGRLGFSLVEGSSEARAWHVLLVGVELDRHTARWLRNAL
jgi:hypothetical protein